MKHATSVALRGTWELAAARGIATLDHTDRFRRRTVLKTDAGEEFLLDLPRPLRLADGDGLRLDEGGFVLVRAAAEPCVLIRCPDPDALARVAWHLGNRHLPVQILPEGLVILEDPVIIDMVEGLGAAVERTTRAFDPEDGAYADGAAAHGRDPGHAHPHG